MGAVKFRKYKQVLPKLEDPLSTTGYTELLSIVSFGLHVSARKTTSVHRKPYSYLIRLPLRQITTIVQVQIKLMQIWFISSLSYIQSKVNDSRLESSVLMPVGRERTKYASTVYLKKNNMYSCYYFSLLLTPHTQHL